MQSEGGHWQYFASSSFTNAFFYFYCSQDGGGRDCYLVAEGGQLLMVWFAVVLTSCLFTVHGVPPYSFLHLWWVSGSIAVDSWRNWPLTHPLLPPAQSLPSC